MAFFSILYPKCESRAETESSEQPAFFKDLNLDQIVAAVTAGRQEYRLQPFFHVSLKDIDAIHYRQEIMRDLQDNVLLGHIQSFARTMRAMREHLAQAAKLYYERQKKAWFVNAMELYCDAVQSLARDLRLVELKSRGLLASRDYVNDYIRTERFTALLSGIRSLRAELSSIKFCLLIRDNSITVRSYESETDYSVEVAETFAKFRQGAVKDYTVKFLSWPEMNHVEAGILDLVAKLHPEVFAHLDEFCSRHTDYLDETIEVFDREVQFYAAYLEFIQRLKEAGLKFCYPEICADRKDIYSLEGFDLALASKLVQENSAVVCNDFYLKDKERIFIVSGPNQGGKTTFARAFGQMHYLASVGCPVPGAKARLFLFDGLFTHFEQEEDIARLRGKLQDDLLRMYDILKRCTPNSIIIINEIFSSTTLKDAIFLSRKIMEKILQLDALCVCVTFIVELAALSEKTVSMVSSVAPDNPTLRTYKISRKPADGLAYAVAIAEKYRLTFRQLRERLKP